MFVEISNTAIKDCRIECGSYVGTGSYSASEGGLKWWLVTTNRQGADSQLNKDGTTYYYIAFSCAKGAPGHKAQGSMFPCEIEFTEP
ncbi:hypothetical protein [Colidextribacter sp. OB.20]|uniref:hypothetical protein n=1 Tax=Colidextribacter sp. OB.20 TaxID=2304568 RepID=UPI00136D16E7|nr:hypothetical protein [Colidextribacter sp. OB.20]